MVTKKIHKPIFIISKTLKITPCSMSRSFSERKWVVHRCKNGLSSSELMHFWASRYLHQNLKTTIAGFAHLVFTGSVLWTEKIHRTKLNQTMVQSIFRLQLPKFGVILVAGCLISKIIQNHSKTGWNRLQLVKQSHVLHSLVMTFITFNLIFGNS